MQSTFLLFVLCLSVLVPTIVAAQKQPGEFITIPESREQAKVRRALGAGFRVVESEHFRVISDTSPRYHDTVTGLLEQFYQLVHPRFFEQEMRPVELHLTHDADGYDELLRDREFPPSACFGFYDPKTRSLYSHRYFDDGRETGVGTLFHETIHAMMHAEFEGRPLPRWFNEGFASLFEVGRVLRGQWVYGNPNPWRETPFRTDFEQGRVPSLERLLATPDDAFELPGGRRKMLYNSGRSLFLFLLRSHGENAVRDFVQGVRSGLEAEAALTAAIGLALPNIERGWHQSIRTLNFGGDYLFRGTGPDALRILQQGVRLHPGYGNLHFQLGVEYFNRGELEKALEQVQLAIADPHFIFRQLGHFLAARSALQTDPRAAFREMQMSVAYQPWNEQLVGDSFVALIFMFDNIGEPARAAKVKEEFERLQREDQRL